MRKTVLVLVLAAALAGCGGNGSGGGDAGSGGTGGTSHGGSGGTAGSGGTGGNNTGGTGGNNTGGTGGSNTGGTGGSEPCPDSDDDGVCDEDDLCPGDDHADADEDGICDGNDVCPGEDDAVADPDHDLLCGDDDPCFGEDNVDDDADGVCDSEDACPGEDDAISDPDHDRLCADVDPCFGADNDHDSDGDGMCDDADLCPGDDAADEDGDSVCDGNDACPGEDDRLDQDSDGVPDTCDNCPTTPNPEQQDDHSYVAWPMPWRPPASGGTEVHLSSHGTTELLPIGFTFLSFDHAYSQFSIAADGFITLGEIAPSTCCSYGLPTNGPGSPEDAPRGVIAAGWTDLDASVGTIRWETRGTEPNRALVVEWDGLRYAGTDQTIHTWLVLYEGTNHIETFAANLPTQVAGGAPITRGAESPDGGVVTAIPSENAGAGGQTNSALLLFTNPGFDGRGDACSNACVDPDFDGLCDWQDTCPVGDDALDADSDGTPDACDRCAGSPEDDNDGDGVPDGCDACPAMPDGVDFDGDGQGDLCADACIGEDDSGDADADGVCDSNDMCPGEDDKLTSCPWLPGHAGGAVTSYDCPAGTWAQGFATRYDGNDDPMGLKLLCIGPERILYEVGEWGAVSEGLPESWTWCSGNEDAEMVGGYVGVGPLWTDAKYIAGMGLLCRSSTTGETWTVPPRKAPLGEYRNPCDGPGEVVVGMKIRTGWLIDDVQFKCGVVAVPNP